MYWRQESECEVAKCGDPKTNENDNKTEPVTKEFVMEDKIADVIEKKEKRNCTKEIVVENKLADVIDNREKNKRNKEKRETREVELKTSWEVERILAGKREMDKRVQSSSSQAERLRDSRRK